MPYLVILSFTPTPYSRRIQPKAHFGKSKLHQKIFLCGAYAPRCFDCAHAPLNMTVKRISHPEPYSNAPLTKDPAARRTKSIIYQTKDHTIHLKKPPQIFLRRLLLLLLISTFTKRTDRFT